MFAQVRFGAPIVHTCFACSRQVQQFYHFGQCNVSTPYSSHLCHNKTNIKLYCVVPNHVPNNIDNKFAACHGPYTILTSCHDSDFEPLFCIDKEQFYHITQFFSCQNKFVASIQNSILQDQFTN